MQKRKLLPMKFCLILIFSVVVILFGGIYIYKYIAIKSIEVVISQQSQSNHWKTYKSSIYDYEINYPVNFKNSEVYASENVTDIDVAEYKNENYFFKFQVFARSADFIVNDCLKNVYGKDISKTIDINGNKFYIFNDKQVGIGGRMALGIGAIQSEYHIMHNNQCYIVIYNIYSNDINPSSVIIEQARKEFQLLDQIFSTFKFIK